MGELATLALAFGPMELAPAVLLVLSRRSDAVSPRLYAPDDVRRRESMDKSARLSPDDETDRRLPESERSQVGDKALGGWLSASGAGGEGLTVWLSGSYTALACEEKPGGTEFARERYASGRRGFWAEAPLVDRMRWELAEPRLTVSSVDEPSLSASSAPPTRVDAGAGFPPVPELELELE